MKAESKGKVKVRLDFEVDASALKLRNRIGGIDIQGASGKIVIHGKIGSFDIQGRKAVFQIPT
jgi:hypothetical protein